MTEFDVVGEDDFCILGDFKRPSKAAERRLGRLAIQDELDDLADLYELPEGLQIPGVRA